MKNASPELIELTTRIMVSKVPTLDPDETRTRLEVLSEESVLNLLSHYDSYAYRSYCERDQVLGSFSPDGPNGPHWQSRWETRQDA